MVLGDLDLKRYLLVVAALWGDVVQANVLGARHDKHWLQEEGIGLVLGKPSGDSTKINDGDAVLVTSLASLACEGERGLEQVLGSLHQRLSHAGSLCSRALLWISDLLGKLASHLVSLDLLLGHQHWLLPSELDPKRGVVEPDDQQLVQVLDDPCWICNKSGEQVWVSLVKQPEHAVNRSPAQPTFRPLESSGLCDGHAHFPGQSSCCWKHRLLDPVEQSTWLILVLLESQFAGLENFQVELLALLLVQHLLASQLVLELDLKPRLNMANTNLLVIGSLPVEPLA